MLVSLLVIGIIVGLTSWHLRLGFSTYIAQSELKDQNALVTRLEALYTARGSWEFFKTSPSAWNTLFESSTPEAYSKTTTTYNSIPESSLNNGRQEPRQRPPAAQVERGRYAPPLAYEDCLGRRAGDIVSHRTPSGVVRAVCRYTPDGLAARPERTDATDNSPANRITQVTPDTAPLQGIAARLVLLDLKGQRLAGAALTGQDKLVKRPIGPADKPIAELALVTIETASGVNQAFLDQSIQIIRLVAVSALLVSLLAAYLLSRNFVDPLRRITQGTRKLASGQYQTRIEVIRGDEFGDLMRDFNRLAHALEQHENNRRLWVAQTSHELRTPVSILRAHIEALIDGVRNPSYKEFEVLQKEVLHLEKLIGDLNELARADSGALAFKKEELDIAELLAESLSPFYELFSTKKISLSVQRCSSALVFGDASRLQQLISNLLENSLRYTNAGGGLEISCTRTPTHVVITFDDTAPTVEPTALASLFDPFFRSNESRQSVSGGSGLGLAICKSIVTAHQGEISAKISSLGGLKIQVVLPLLETKA